MSDKNKQPKPSKLQEFRDTVMYNIPGPKALPLRCIINFQKGMTCFFVVYLMSIYQNFSSGCYLYLGLHGSYGLMWLLKDFTFPDASWQQTATLPSFLVVGSGLALYWVMPWMMASGIGIQDPSGARIFICILIYTFGLVFMIGADAQKYYTLKYKKGLISEGFFKYTRNPNYLGEIMIYWSFANAVGTFWAYCIPASIWFSLFLINMLLKEESYKRKAGWDVYKEQSYMLFFRIFKNHALNVIFYIGLFYFLYEDWQYGGFILKLKK